MRDTGPANESAAANGRLAGLAARADGLAARANGLAARAEKWADRRELAPRSLAGISLLVATVAAAWLSGRTTLETLVGVLAVVGWLLTRTAATRLAARTGDRAFAWPFAVATTAGECVVYAGIAVGGQLAGWPGMWPLAVAAITAIAVADLLVACGAGALPAGWAGRVLAPPPGLRVLLAVLMLVLAGPRVALFSVLAIEVLSVGVVGTRRGREVRQGSADVVRTCRDDGALARWVGRLLQGKLPPLPAAIGGTAGSVLLAAVGLRGALGFVSLAPVVVLMLAAVGSGSPHEGRFDWLVPAVMALGQYVYLASLGFAWKVPGPAVFALCAMTAVWYAGLAAGQRAGSAGRVRPAGIGWEERLFVAGLTAIIGIATFGYVVLATYLAVLIGRQALAGPEDAIDRAGARGRGKQAAPPGD